MKGADSSGNAEFPEVNGTQIKENLSEEGKGSGVKRGEEVRKDD